MRIPGYSLNHIMIYLVLSTIICQFAYPEVKRYYQDIKCLQSLHKQLLKVPYNLCNMKASTSQSFILSTQKKTPHCRLIITAQKTCQPFANRYLTSLHHSPWVSFHSTPLSSGLST